MDQIQMAEYWDQWNSTVTKILNPEVSQTLWNFSFLRFWRRFFFS